MRICRYVLVALAFAGMLSAQVTSRLTGSVIDQTGAAVPGATVDVYLPGGAKRRAGDSVVNGQRTSFTNVTLDGINIQDNFIRTNAVDFSPNLLLTDQVAEMTISTSNSNPAFGNGASQITMITPSGTNQ